MKQRGIWKVCWLLGTLLCLLTAGTALVHAEEDQGFLYTIEGETATVTGLADSAQTGDIVIPDTLGGYPVTALGEEALSRSKAVTLSIPATVNKLEKLALANSSKLNQVIFRGESQLQTIGASAFYNCRALHELALPPSVTEIGDRAFGDCVYLERMILPPGVRKLGEYMFEFCYRMVEVRIPQGVTVLPPGLFSGCGDLTQVTLPEGLTTIRYNVFEECSDLEMIRIPEGVTELEGATFEGCYSLKALILPRSIRVIYDAFGSQDKKLKNVYYCGTQEEWAQVRQFNSQIAKATVHTDFSPEFAVRYQDSQAVVNLPQVGSYTLIFAAYQGTELRDVEVRTVRAAYESLGETAVQPSGFAPAEGDQVRVFLWDGLGTGCPLAPAL